VIGLLVGIVAKFLMPGRQGGGFIVTALLGIVGAVVATFLGQAMGIYAAGQSRNLSKDQRAPNESLPVISKR
jgi:uncharacterized membrane protein YeaQ/YmgE (transglycosylase-associated protein family)